MNIASYIDHTLLRPDATAEQIRTLCQEAIENKFYAVCVNASRVAVANRAINGSKVKLAAVVGFPLGATDKDTKAHEAAMAVWNGADEIDMVINIGMLKEGDYAGVLEDIKGVVRSASRRPVKVIIETCLLTDDEKVKACKLAVEAGAKFVKTSTGFSTGGATVEDIRLIRQAVGSDAEVKASGGIKDAEKALQMIEAGATRIGTSSGVSIVKNAPAVTGAY